MTEHSWQPILLGSAEIPALEPPTISGIAYPGRRHIWSGEPETMKSFAALIPCVEEIRSGRAVFYVDLENGPTMMRERLHHLGLSDEEIDASFVYLEPAEPLTRKEIREDLATLVAARHPSLVVFDSYAGMLALHGHDDWRAAAIERYNREVVELFRAHGAATIHLDHLTKNREGRGKYTIGSERKVAGADVHVTFEVAKPFGRGQRGLVKLIVHKDRPGFLHRPKAATIELVSDPETWAITWAITVAESSGESDETGTRFRPTGLMEKVSFFIEKQSEPVTRHTVENQRFGRAEYVRLAMDCLANEGYAEPTNGPRSARLLKSIRPFREPDLVPTSSRSDDLDFVPTSSLQIPLSNA